jgi:hypothetical protein
MLSEESEPRVLLRRDMSLEFSNAVNYIVSVAPQGAARRRK